MEYIRTLRLFSRNMRLCLAAFALVVGFGFMGVFSLLINLYLLRLGYSIPFIGIFGRRLACSAGLVFCARRYHRHAVGKPAHDDPLLYAHGGGAYAAAGQRMAAARRSGGLVVIRLCVVLVRGPRWASSTATPS